MGVLDEAAEQVLLERHSLGRGSTSECCMDIVGDVFDLDARHDGSLPGWRQHGAAGSDSAPGGEGLPAGPGWQAIAVARAVALVLDAAR